MHPKSLELLSCSYLLSFVQKCHVKNKDIRKFLDGIYVSEKGTVVEEEWGERFQLHQHGGSSVQASFFNLLGFQKSFKYNICWILARVSVFRSFVMLWDCFCIFMLCPCSTNMSYSHYTFDSKTSISNCRFFAYESSATLHELEFNSSETRCLWHTS